MLETRCRVFLSKPSRGKEAWSFAQAKVLKPNASKFRRWSERACLRGMPDTDAHFNRKSGTISTFSLFYLLTSIDLMQQSVVFVYEKKAPGDFPGGLCLSIINLIACPLRSHQRLKDRQESWYRQARQSRRRQPFSESFS